MKIISQINQLEMMFGSSFKNTSRVRYDIDFDNSRVVDIIDKLNLLDYKVKHNINTGKYAPPIDNSDVQIVLNSLEAIVVHFKEINKIQTISPRIKLYDMINMIRMNEQPSPKVIAKEVLTEVLSPSKEGKKLTRKQIIEKEAAQKSNERRLDLLKRQAKDK